MQWLFKRIFLRNFLRKDTPVISIDDAFAQKHNYIFLDARERNEFEISHIKSAAYVGFEDFNMMRLKNIKKDEQIIVYCSVGLRSDRITRKLIDAGYVNAKNLYGGIFEWLNKDFEIVDVQEMETKNIHPFNKKFGAWLNKGIKVYNK